MGKRLTLKNLAAEGQIGEIAISGTGFLWQSVTDPFSSLD
jgi:hypothetical protein